MRDFPKAVFDEQLVRQNAGRAAEIRAIDDHFLLRIERFQGVLETLEMDRTGNTFRPEHPIVQTIDEAEALAGIQLCLQLFPSNGLHRLESYVVAFVTPTGRAWVVTAFPE